MLLLGTILLIGCAFGYGARAAPSAAPRIDTMLPAASLTTVGTRAVLQGSGFARGDRVFFGSRDAPFVDVVSSTEILARSPPGAAPTSPLRLTLSLGGTGGRAQLGIRVQGANGLPVAYDRLLVAPGTANCGAPLATMTGAGGNLSLRLRGLRPGCTVSVLERADGPTAAIWVR